MRIRIISGAFGGRYLDSPDTFTTHPMSERMRGALFNILGDISGFQVLDAFAGSGALGLEALSRGAAHAVFVEKDRIAQKVIDKNIAALKIDRQASLVKAPVASWSSTTTHNSFDLIICDPPYTNMQLSTISNLIKHLKPNGLMVLSHPGRESAPTVNGVVVVDKRLYGDAALAIYRRDA